MAFGGGVIRLMRYSRGLWFGWKSLVGDCGSGWDGFWLKGNANCRKKWWLTIVVSYVWDGDDQID